MAENKTRSLKPAVVHAVVYSVGFVLFTRSVLALAVICVTHCVIDRWRLARYVCWLKNFLAPRYIGVADGAAGDKKRRNLPWQECNATGYPPGKPPWLSVWLMIFVDNIIHVLINAAAIKYL